MLRWWRWWRQLFEARLSVGRTLVSLLICSLPPDNCIFTALAAALLADLLAALPSHQNDYNQQRQKTTRSRGENIIEYRTPQALSAAYRQLAVPLVEHTKLEEWRGSTAVVEGSRQVSPPGAFQGTYTAYIIRVTEADGTSWVVLRRFSDFQALHETLSPAFERPLEPMPPKR